LDLAKAIVQELVFDVKKYTTNTDYFKFIYSNLCEFTEDENAQIHDEFMNECDSTDGVLLLIETFRKRAIGL
jgi:hypothetical protein